MDEKENIHMIFSFSSFYRSVINNIKNTKFFRHIQSLCQFTLFCADDTPPLRWLFNIMRPPAKNFESEFENKNRNGKYEYN